MASIFSCSICEFCFFSAAVFAEDGADFEAEIAYFFGVGNTISVIESYTNALKTLEELGADSSAELLEREIVPYLEEAYRSIAQQRGWGFDMHLAAQMELQIILGNANGSSFEVVKNLMVQLYALVFESDLPCIQKAAMLRTFLYQYKADL
ncbi:MAG: hypothetical protein K2Y01_06020 [Rhabdochlamydiaceae bacterium]|nr:hypothetical protein [Rhabdochlamydiaceae bacterium]